MFSLRWLWKGPEIRGQIAQSPGVTAPGHAKQDSPALRGQGALAPRLASAASPFGERWIVG